MTFQTFVRAAYVVGFAWAAMLSAPAAAQYPDKPIRLVVPWPAGGGSDVIARIVALSMGERLKQPVVVDNRPGANGAIGSDIVARAPKDGYTLVWVTADTHAINPHVYPKLTYDPRKDFVAVGIAGYFPYVLVVNPAFSVSNIAELSALAAQRPGNITFASWGVGGSSHVGMEIYMQQAKVQMLHVPFLGAAPAMLAVVAGQVDAMMVPMAAADGFIKSGKLKSLGLAAPSRFAGVPDLKTMAEQGVPVNAGSWLGIMAPTGTSPEILAILNRTLNAAVESAPVREAMLKLNTEPSTMTVP